MTCILHINSVVSIVLLPLCYHYAVLTGVLSVHNSLVMMARYSITFTDAITSRQEVFAINRLGLLLLVGECISFVTDVQQLCGSCPHLSELDLSDAAMLTSQSIDHIVLHLPSLRYLAVSRCYRITLQGLA